ncbi:MAG: TPM domain-containing protein [Clostridia bacterium]
MKLLKKCKITILIFCFLLTTNAFAAKNEYLPTNEFFINDFANILSQNTKTQVYNNSIAIQKATTAQLVVVTVPDMNGHDISSFTNELFNKFKIGEDLKDNGVLLLIAKKERKVRIEVGYGLEGALNDSKVGRILDDKALPYLKNNDYDNAVLNTIAELQGIIYNEYGIVGGFDNYKEKPLTIFDIIFSILFFLSPILIMIFAMNNKKRHGTFFFGGPFGGSGFGGGSGGGFSRWWRFISAEVEPQEDFNTKLL